MPSCVCCGERVGDDRTECPICGTKIPASALPAEEYVAEISSSAPTAAPGDLTPGSFFCPSCAKIYPSDHREMFCECGTELVTAGDDSAKAIPATAPTAVYPFSPAKRPPPGTRCIVLYGPDKQPRQYFPLQKDSTLIGRLDAIGGVFPDIDLTDYLEKDAARRVSRRHALVLRSRATGKYVLRPLAGNTGTQIDADMVAPLEDYPLENGRRIVLGGAVWLKFEVV